MTTLSVVGSSRDPSLLQYSSSILFTSTPAQTCTHHHRRLSSFSVSRLPSILLRLSHRLLSPFLFPRSLIGRIRIHEQRPDPQHCQGAAALFQDLFRLNPRARRITTAALLYPETANVCCVSTFSRSSSQHSFFVTFAFGSSHSLSVLWRSTLSQAPACCWQRIGHFSSSLTRR